MDTGSTEKSMEFRSNARGNKLAEARAAEKKAARQPEGGRKYFHPAGRGIERRG